MGKWSSLDNLEFLKAGDPGGMLPALAGLAEQCEKAIQLAKKVEISYPQSFQQILVTGLGGSAIGGDFLRVYAEQKCTLPVMVNRDYSLPLFVGKNTLVFAVSYSGNTEETLSAYHEAQDKGAALVAITSGGQLAKKARADGVPLITIPAGIQPRAATGYLFIPTLIVLEKLGLIPGVANDLEGMISSLADLGNRLAPEVDLAQNQAKKLAATLYQKIPVIWGASGTTETTAMRWKGQINENSKALAYFNVLPELNHNEIVGTEAPVELLKDIELIFLRTEDDHPRVQKRFEITKELIGSRVGGITEVWGQGENFLARIFSLTYLGDYTSVYLALLYGIDPSPVYLISSLKDKLAAE